MSRLLARTVRLLKIGAVIGAAVGVGRMVMRRRRQPEASESSWPTIAETAAQNGQPVDDRSPDDGADSSASPDDEDSPSAEADDGTDDEADEDNA